MLLTSGQISVAISSFIIFIFTTALFLSGYILQQQTVRDLREAIKPQFQARLVGLELPDNLNMYADADRSRRKEKTGVHLLKKLEMDEVQEVAVKAGIGREIVTSEEEIDRVREKIIRKTRSGRDETWSEIGGRVLEAQQEREDGEKEDDELMIDMASVRREERENTIPEKPPSRAERRRKIKEDLVTSGEGETFTGYRRRVSGA
ncbi:hypothetical protein SBOR_10157 [Sclerotinia borealis F-4128]|uniref:Uncharacterized protein n=1 Tax=Sclerotinia borealis (strain F-4128) TaxID=1432307 RepID=W9C4H2_SCLBF|nr:hypothetical protein SBOR_10157 [Sclerotinia borealis F-4128]